MAKTAGEAIGPDAKLDPVFARALREALFWLLAALALVLLIALSSFDASDRSFSYTGEPGQVGNLIGPLGAWLSSALFMLFGWPAFLFPVAIAFSAWTGLKRAPGAAGPGSLHGRLARDRTRRGARNELRPRDPALLRGRASSRRGRHPRRPGRSTGSPGSHRCSARRSSCSHSGSRASSSTRACPGSRSWTGSATACSQARAWMRARLATSRDQAVGRESREARETAVREVQKKAEKRTPPRIELPAPPVPAASKRVEKERQVPLFAKPASRDLPELKLLDEPPARTSTYSPEALDAISRLVEIKLKDFGIEVEVVAVQPGPVVTRFELKPAPGVKVSQISALSKDLARALSAISVRVVEVIPGQGRGRPRDPERDPGTGDARRDPALARLRRARLAARARARQGHRRQPGRRGPRQDAAPADRRHHRLRQVGRDQRDGAFAALQELGRARAPDPDRPEDARALRVRGHSAPAGAGRDRHEARGQCAALVRRRDGAALSPDEGARRPEPRRLQPQGARRAGRRPSDSGPADREASLAWASSRARFPPCSRCRSSSS